MYQLPTYLFFIKFECQYINLIRCHFWYKWWFYIFIKNSQTHKTRYASMHEPHRNLNIEFCIKPYGNWQNYNGYGEEE